MRRTQSFKPLSDKHRVGQDRYQGYGLLTHLVEIGLLPCQQSAAYCVDDMVVALGIYYPAIMKHVGVGGKLVLDLQVVGRKDNLPTLERAIDDKSGALSRDPLSGLATLDAGRCVGCWMCYMVCPWGIAPDAESGRAVRCDACADLPSAACVDACPSGALSSGEAEEEGTTPRKGDFTGRIVVVGASAAGLAACEAAIEYAPRAEIILVAADAVFGYSRPMLPWLGADDADETKLIWRSEDYFEKKLGIRLVKGMKAVGLDPETRTVMLDGGDKLTFDRLVIATGARGVMPEIPGIDKEGVFTLRNMEEEPYRIGPDDG